MIASRPFVNRRSALLVLAAAWVGAAAGTAGAQIKVGDEGRALDANQRVGSGGYNTPRPNLQLVNPNDIVYGSDRRRTAGSAATSPATYPAVRRAIQPPLRPVRALRQRRLSAPHCPAPAPPAPTSRPSTRTRAILGPRRHLVLNPYTGQYQAHEKYTPGIMDIQYGVPPARRSSARERWRLAALILPPAIGRRAPPAACR